MRLDHQPVGAEQSGGPAPEPAGPNEHEQLQAVELASARLEAAEAGLAEHNRALAAWADFLGGVRTDLATAEARDTEVQAGIAALHSRLEATERALASLSEMLSAEVALARETRSAFDARLADLEHSRASRTVARGHGSRPPEGELIATPPASADFP